MLLTVDILEQIQVCFWCKFNNMTLWQRNKYLILIPSWKFYWAILSHYIINYCCPLKLFKIVRKAFVCIQSNNVLSYRGLQAARRANKPIAQGNALGKRTPTYFALKEQKNLTINAFALTARRFHIHSYLGRCPRL